MSTTIILSLLLTEQNHDLTFFLLPLLDLLACEADFGGMASRVSSAPSLSPPSLSSPVCGTTKHEWSEINCMLKHAVVPMLCSRKNLCPLVLS